MFKDVPSVKLTVNLTVNLVMGVHKALVVMGLFVMLMALARVSA